MELHPAVVLADRARVVAVDTRTAAVVVVDSLRCKMVEL